MSSNLIGPTTYFAFLIIVSTITFVVLSAARYLEPRSRSVIWVLDLRGPTTHFWSPDRDLGKRESCFSNASSLDSRGFFNSEFEFSGFITTDHDC